MYQDKVLAAMREVFKDTPEWIEHTLNVQGYAEAIMEGENIYADQRELISIVTLLHDIGVIEAQRKYGSMAAPYQEKECPVVARQILQEINYPSPLIERVCYIVGNHHTQAKIDGRDFQIQWEADWLVNLEGREILADKPRLRAFIEENFKTVTGKNLACSRFGLTE